MLSEILVLDAARLGLLGIVLSALVASLGYYGKLRHERRKTRRVVLFQLLRIRDLTLWEDRAAQQLPTDLVSSVESALLRHQLLLADDFRSRLVQTATHSLEAFLRERTRASIDRLLPELHSALVDLAKDDPLLASGISEGLPEAAPADRPEATSAEVNSTFSNGLIAALTRSARITTLERVTRTVRWTALECSLFTWISVELKLWNQSRWKPTSTIAQSVDQAVEDLVRSLVRDEALNQSQATHAATSTK